MIISALETSGASHFPTTCGRYPEIQSSAADPLCGDMLAKASFADSADRVVAILVYCDSSFLVTRLAIGRASFFAIVLGAF